MSGEQNSLKAGVVPAAPIVAALPKMTTVHSFITEAGKRMACLVVVCLPGLIVEGGYASS